MTPNPEDEIPASVKAMMVSGDPMVPTAPLDDFLIAYALDSNIWWSISCGHHQNLFDAACDRAGLM